MGRLVGVQVGKFCIIIPMSSLSAGCMYADTCTYVVLWGMLCTCLCVVMYVCMYAHT